jgi:tRNA nucleotidyltransferase/poly(A) polymerase
MALEIGRDPPALIDPFGGQADLRAQRLRAVSDQAMVKDPVRGLRAVRLAAQLGFRVDPETRELIRAAAYRLPRVSAERIQEEFLKTLATPGVAGSLRQLDDLGLLGEFLPEVTALRGVAQSRPHRFDVYEHTLHVVAALEMYLPLKGAALHPDVPYPEQVAEHLAREVAGGQSRRTLLALATLLHDAGKPGTATVEQGGRIRFFNHERAGAEIAGDVLRRLRFSGEATRLTAAIVRHHLRPLQLAWERSTSRRAAHRFFRHAGEAGVEVALLSLADHRATYGPDADVEEYSVLLRVVDALLDAYFNRQASVVAPAPLLGGRDLMREFGLKEGPALGRLLDALREAQAVGEVDSRSEARRWVKRRIEEWELEEGDRRGDTWKSR